MVSHATIYDWYKAKGAMQHLEAKRYGVKFDQTSTSVPMTI